MADIFGNFCVRGKKTVLPNKPKALNAGTVPSQKKII